MSDDNEDGWKLSEEDRRRIRENVAAQLAAHPGPLPPRIAGRVLAALRELRKQKGTQT